MVLLAFVSEICLSLCLISLLVSVFCERVTPSNNVFPRVKRLSSIGFCYLISKGFILALDSTVQPQLHENGGEMYALSIAVALIIIATQQESPQESTT